MTITEIAQMSAAGATVILVVITFFYVLATWSMAKEMKTARETQLRPYMIIDFDFPKINLCDMIIKNVGNGAAFDVQIHFEPDVVYREPDIKLSDLPIFQRLKFFPAGKEIRFFFRDMRDKYKINVQNQFNANLRYKDSAGKIYDETLSLDIGWHKKLMFAGVNDFDDLVKSVEKIAKSNGKIQEQLKRLTDLEENKEQSS